MTRPRRDAARDVGRVAAERVESALARASSWRAVALLVPALVCAFH